jgi:hypothetical protein
MAEKLNFLIEFETAQRSLRELRRGLEQQLQGLKLDIQPNIRQPAGGAGGAAAGAAGGGGARLLSDLSRARQQAKEAEEKFVKASTVRTTNLEKIAALQARVGTLTTEEEGQLRRANASKGGLTTATNRAKTVFEQVSAQVQILSNTFKAINSVADAASQGLSAIGEQGEFKLDATGLQGGLDVLDTLVGEVITGVFTPLAKAGLPARAIDASLKVLATEINNEKDIFDKLGFDVENNKRLVQLGFEKLGDALSQAGINVIAATQGVRRTSSGRPDVDEAKAQVAIKAAQDAKARAIEVAAQAEISLAAGTAQIKSIAEDQAAGLTRINALQTEREVALSRSNLAESSILKAQLEGRNVSQEIVEIFQSNFKRVLEINSELEAQRERIAAQNRTVEEIRTGQQSIKNATLAQARAAQQAAGAAQEQAAELARRVEPEIAGLDLGPQSDALRAQIAQGVAAVARFRAGLIGAEEPLDGFGLGARLLQRSSSGLARVQENAALAQQVVADDLREQAAAIVASTARQLEAGTLTQTQADANAASVQQLGIKEQGG